MAFFDKLLRRGNSDDSLSQVQADVTKLHERYIKLIKQRHTVDRSIQAWGADQGPEIAKFTNCMTAFEERSNLLSQQYAAGLQSHITMWDTMIEDKKELATVEAELKKCRDNVEKYRASSEKHENNLKKLAPMSDKFETARQKAIDYSQKEAVAEISAQDREVQLQEKLKQLYMHEHDALRQAYYTLSVMRVKHLKALTLMEWEQLRAIEQFPRVTDLTNSGFEYGQYDCPLGQPIDGLFTWVDESKLREDPEVMSALSFTIPTLPHASSLPAGVQPEVEHIHTPAATLAEITRAAMPNDAEMLGVHPAVMQRQQAIGQGPYANYQSQNQQQQLGYDTFSPRPIEFGQQQQAGFDQPQQFNSGIDSTAQVPTSDLSNLNLGGGLGRTGDTELGSSGAARVPNAEIPSFISSRDVDVPVQGFDSQSSQQSSSFIPEQQTTGFGTFDQQNLNTFNDQSNTAIRNTTTSGIDDTPLIKPSEIRGGVDADLVNQSVGGI